MSQKTKTILKYAGVGFGIGFILALLNLLLAYSLGWERWPLIITISELKAAISRYNLLLRIYVLLRFFLVTEIGGIIYLGITGALTGIILNVDKKRKVLFFLLIVPLALIIFYLYYFVLLRMFFTLLPPD